MANARSEFEDFISEVGIRLLCAVVKREGRYPDNSDRQEFVLSHPEELPQFLELLNFEYSDEKLKDSICWFEDGSWGEVDYHNCDGIDIYYWCHRSLPAIPGSTYSRGREQT